MAMTTDPDELTAIRERAAKATAGPWRSMRDGNQYIGTRYQPTSKLVGASRVDGIVRPWNPYKYNFNPVEMETARFLDADADFIANARSDIPELLRRLDAAVAERDELREALREVVDAEDAHTALKPSERGAIIEGNAIVRISDAWERARSLLGRTAGGGGG